MSSAISIQHPPEKTWAKQHTFKIPIWVWLASAAVIAILLFFDQRLLVVGFIAFLVMRIVSVQLYERYSGEYKDYEKEYHELFRDINNILGVNRGYTQGFNTDVDEISKQQVEEEKTRLKELQRKNKNEMNRREQWQLAILSERYNATAEPLRLFLIYKADYPDDLDADYLIAKVLLSKNSKSGLTFLKRAFRKFNLILPICELLNGYYFNYGDEGKSNYWLEKKNTFLSVADDAKQERTSLMGRGELVEASLSDKQLGNIAKQLAEVKGLKTAWICEKIVEHYPEYPAYVLLIKRKHIFVDEQKILTTLNSDMDFPDTTLIVSQNSKSRHSARKIKKVGKKIAF